MATADYPFAFRRMPVAAGFLFAFRRIAAAMAGYLFALGCWLDAGNPLGAGKPHPYCLLKYPLPPVCFLRALPGRLSNMRVSAFAMAGL